MDNNTISELTTKYRRDLHSIPELGFHENETGKYIRNILSQLNCTVEPVIETGLAAFFDFGEEKTLAFRGDMDALPIQEATGLPFASKHDGVMHACGHDGHMANLLGFAHVLDELLQSGAHVPFNGLLIFQPAEEIIDGARSVCETDLLDRYNVKNVYGLHLWPMLEKGAVSSRPGPMMARSTEVNVDIEGLSAHCGQPEKGRDALLAGCRFVNDIYSFRENEISDPGLISFGKMHSGNVRNAISPATRIEGSMRTFYERTWKAMTDKMLDIGSSLKTDLGVHVSVDFSKGHQSVMNDEKLYQKIRPALMKLDYLEMEEPVMIAEDFSFFQRKRPGVFFFLGTGSGIPLHSDTYTFDEDVLEHGVRLFEKLFLFADQ